MDKYYYLVSSLPLVLFEDEKFPEIKDFLDQCKMRMSSQDFTIIKSCTIDGNAPGDSFPRILNDWLNWESSLRNELARLRSKKLGFSEDQFAQISTSDSILSESAKKAFEDKSPLNAELTLNKTRWDFLSELELGHYFDLEFIVIYYLKIQLLQRQANFGKENGVLEFSEIKERFFQRTNNNQEKTLEKE